MLHIPYFVYEFGRVKIINFFRVRIFTSENMVCPKTYVILKSRKKNLLRQYNNFLLSSDLYFSSDNSGISPGAIRATKSLVSILLRIDDFSKETLTSSWKYQVYDTHVPKLSKASFTLRLTSDCVIIIRRSIERKRDRLMISVTARGKILIRLRHKLAILVVQAILFATTLMIGSVLCLINELTNEIALAIRFNLTVDHVLLPNE